METRTGNQDTDMRRKGGGRGAGNEAARNPDEGEMAISTIDGVMKMQRKRRKNLLLHLQSVPGLTTALLRRNARNVHQNPRKMRRSAIVERGRSLSFAFGTRIRIRRKSLQATNRHNATRQMQIAERKLENCQRRN